MSNIYQLYKFVGICVSKTNSTIYIKNLEIKTLSTFVEQTISIICEPKLIFGQVNKCKCLQYLKNDCMHELRQVENVTTQ